MFNNFQKILIGSLVFMSFATVAVAEEVTYNARAKDSKAFADVENNGDAEIQVTQIVVSFYDAENKLMSKGKLDCTHDCEVPADEARSFGPIEGPAGWDHVLITKVYYSGGAEEPAEDENAEEGAEDTSATAASNAATEEVDPSVCDTFCKKVNSVPGCENPGALENCSKGCKSVLGPAGCLAKVKELDECTDKTKITCVDKKPVFGVCASIDKEIDDCANGKKE